MTTSVKGRLEQNIRAARANIAIHAVIAAAWTAAWQLHGCPRWLAAAWLAFDTVCGAANLAGLRRSVLARRLYEASPLAAYLVEIRSAFGS